MQITSGCAILIVGAGPTGLVLGIELARRGVSFRLIDRLKEPLKWSRAIFIKSLPQNETEAILNERLEELGARVERGMEFIGLEQSESSIQVRVRSEEAGDQVIDASWVAGTDGCHSGVRPIVDNSFDGRDYRQIWGVVDAEISGWQHPREITCVQLQPAFVAFFPLGEDHWRIYFRAESAHSSVLTNIRKRIGAISPGAELQRYNDLNFFHAQARIAQRFKAGRVLIAGDAAHLSNPCEAHGLNTGIQDAYNLGWKLAAAASGTASDTLIESYQAERRGGYLNPAIADERSSLISYRQRKGSNTPP
jgi:2-polyprenyl-6-methoxyphenol hydroxylase-like FAD-dependent oxidoreductase